MANEDRRQEVEIKEGILKKGGLNAQPLTQRPAPPQAQNPEPTQSNDNNTDSD